jgi:phenylacetate-CoA ligase
MSDKKFCDTTWSDVSGIPFPLKWYRELFGLHHYTMSGRSLDYWQEYKDSQFWSEAQWSTYLDERFVSIVRHAYFQVPFYRKLYDEHGISIENIRGLADIQQLPLVEKSALSMGIGDLSFDGDLANESSLLIRTSGSTGSRMSFTCDTEQLDRRWAVWMRLFEWSGWQWGNKEVRFWYKYASTVKNPKVEAFDAFLSNRHFYEFDALDDSELAYFCDELRRLEPFVITGYWEAIESIAKYAARNDISLHVKAILPSTQVVSPRARRLVAKVFNCAILDKYASAEFSGMGHQCEQEHLYHVQSENVFLEILRDGCRLDEGTGEAIVTDFSNRSTPLIRYRVGDVLEATKEACVCSRTLPVFKRPLGRLKNTIVLSTKILSEMELADFEFLVWQKGLCDRVKFVQSSMTDVVVLASKVTDVAALEREVEQLTAGVALKLIPVDTIDHFRGKRHRGETKLQNIFNN